jgi:acetyl esterase/lipase
MEHRLLNTIGKNRAPVQVSLDQPGSPHPESLAPELLWPEGAPGWQDVPDLESTTNRDVEQNELGLNRAIARVSRPSITAYLPPPEQATGVAVVVLPGGGFHHLAIDKEGYDVARWLCALGAAAIVVKYRTMIDDRGEAIAAALQDTQRAIRVVRSRAQEWHVDPGKVGVLGFSAGGHLVAEAATRWDAGQPDALDPVERASCKPDFLGLLDPGIPEGVEDRVTAETGPAFIAQAGDDFLDPLKHALRFYTALRQAQVPAEMHLYAQGGHGFGLGVSGGSVASWPERFAAWLEVVTAG